MTAGFPDLALSEADRVWSLRKILNFQEKDGKGAKEHANALFDDKGKARKGTKERRKEKERTRTARTEKERKRGKKEKESLERTRTARTKEREVPQRTVGTK